MRGLANLTRLAGVVAVLLCAVPIGPAGAQFDPEAEARVERSVVQLSAWAVGTEDGKAAERVIPRGSGTFVSPDGLILTNHHVVDLDPARATWTQEADQATRQGRALTLEARQTFVVSIVFDPEASMDPDRRHT